jgi:hypothetical protein
MKVTKVLEYRINCDIYIPYTNTAAVVEQELITCTLHMSLIL